MKLNPLEFKLFRLLEPYRGARLLVAVSGGADSVALLYLLERLRTKLEFEVKVAHVHHGRKGVSPAQVKFRTQAQRLTEELAAAFALEFIDASRGQEATAPTENELRKFRHERLENARQNLKFDFVVFAHHADDLFETRLLRLLRGTGAEGFKAMRIKAGKKLRPLLGISRVELEDYLASRKAFFVQDPSNATAGPLRNWLRHVWLKELEKKSPGAKRSLSRSMALLAEAVSFSSNSIKVDAVLVQNDNESSLNRERYDGLTKREKRLVISTYLRSLDAQNVSRSQIEEVIKRLDTRQKRLMFQVGPLKWSINAQQIRADLLNPSLRRQGP